MEEYAREPCPWRIVDDCGGAFTMGAIGGGVFQAVKGFRNAPAIRNFNILYTHISNNFRLPSTVP
uniref:Translocase of inner mitochondrial membrane 17 homolog B (yeast) n=1 Tax=Hippocampus comes TaxID=109280 RepID=A0A3Q2Y2Y7_HIPCM